MNFTLNSLNWPIYLRKWFPLNFITSKCLNFKFYVNVKDENMSDMFKIFLLYKLCIDFMHTQTKENAEWEISYSTDLQLLIDMFVVGLGFLFSLSIQCTVTSDASFNILTLTRGREKRGESVLKIHRRAIHHVSCLLSVFCLVTTSYAGQTAINSPIVACL